MWIQNICVLGGTGFVGSHLISQLSQAGKHIRVLTRHRDRGKHLAMLKNVEIIETDIHRQEKLNQYFADMDAVINLVGILNESGHRGDGFRQAHVELPRKIITACHENKVPRLLHMSALNAGIKNNRSFYLKTKGEGEQYVHAFAGKIAVSSFRPSVIFGEGDNFFNRFAALLKSLPLAFPLACAHSRFAPVYVNDLAAFMVQSLNEPQRFGQRYDICGPRQYSLQQLVAYTAAQLGLKRRIIPLPDKLSHLQAMIMEYVPGKPFSLDNYYACQQDSVCTEKSLFFSTPIEAVLPVTLGQLNREKQLDHYRHHALR